jgi:4-carboxymuconolactone decarboxylase
VRRETSNAVIGGEPQVSERKPAADRRALGLAMYREVYGENAPLPEGGSAEFFELLVIDQQFAEVWSRRALGIPARRLLTIGVLAATRRFDIVQFQFRRALESGELTPEQVREVVIHLVSYVGTPSSGDLYRASEAAIAAHAAAGKGAASAEGKSAS